MSSAEQTPSAEKPAPASPLPGLDPAFLRRSVVSAAVTMAVVACFGALYSPLWSARFAFFGFWALSFFTLTGLILQNFMFGGSRARGLVYAGLKIAAMGAALVVMTLWPVAADNRPDVIAMITGLSAPFLILVLRVIGAIVQQAGDDKSALMISMRQMREASAPVAAPRRESQMRSGARS